MTTPAAHAAMRRQFRADIALICERLGYSTQERKFLLACFEGNFNSMRNYRCVAGLMEEEDE